MWRNQQRKKKFFSKFFYDSVTHFIMCIIVVNCLFIYLSSIYWFQNENKSSPSEWVSVWETMMSSYIIKFVDDNNKWNFFFLFVALNSIGKQEKIISIHPSIHLLWIGCSGKHKQDGTIFILISSSSSWLSCFCLFDFDSFWWWLPPLLLIDANGQSYLTKQNKTKKKTILFDLDNLFFIIINRQVN